MEIYIMGSQIEEEQNKVLQKDNQHSELTEKWKDDHSSLSKTVEDLTEKIQNLENTIKTKDSFIQQLVSISF